MVALFLNAAGDHLLTLPALRALSASAQGHLVLVARRGFAGKLLRDVPTLALIEIEAAYVGGQYAFDAARLAQDLRPFSPIETLVSLNPWHSEEIDRLLSTLRPRRSIGFHPLFGEPLTLDFSKHSSELAFDAARAVDPDADLDRWSYPPALSKTAIATAVRLRHAANGRHLLAVHTDTKPAKAWREEAWTDLLDAWLSSDPRRVAIDLGLGDRSHWLVRSDARGRWISDLGLGLDHALGVLRVADRFIGVDSCFLHAADLERVAGVGIFGPTDPREFGFRWSPHRHVQAPDLGRLTPDAVLRALSELDGQAVPHTTAGRAAGAPPLRRAGRVAIDTADPALRDPNTAPGSIIASLQSGGGVAVAANDGGGSAPPLIGYALRRAFAQGIVAREQVFVYCRLGRTDHLPARQRSRLGVGDQFDLGAGYLRWELDQQLRFLGLETADAVVLEHPALGRVGDEALVEDAFSFLEEAVERGDVGMYGVAVPSLDAVRSADPAVARLLASAERLRGSNHHFRIVEARGGLRAAARLVALSQ